jgi:P27 family predicted phage terminase small subunit
VPRALKLVRGTYRKDRTAAAEPEPRILSHYPAPAWLEPLAREEWERIEPELRACGLLTVVDLMSLAAYCCEVATFRQAQAQLTSRSRMKLVTKSYLLGTRRRAAAEIRRWAAEFGFTPSARSRVGIAPAPPTPDPLDRFLTVRGRPRPEGQ